MDLEDGPFETSQNDIPQVMKTQTENEPPKCAFRVTTGKILKFIVWDRRIEWPHQSKGNYRAPSSKKHSELKGLEVASRISTGSYQSCDEEVTVFKWNQQCQEALESIKMYITKRCSGQFHQRKASSALHHYPRLIIGILLAQENTEDKENALYYLS